MTPKPSLAERIEALRAELFQVYGDPINELRAIASELREIASDLRGYRDGSTSLGGLSMSDSKAVELADRLARREP